MKLSTLKGRTSTVYVDVPPEEGDEGGEVEKVEVKYKPGELTLGLMDDLKELASNPSAADAESLRVFLQPLISWWDLEDEEGNNLAVTEATFKVVPIVFLSEILVQIQNDSLPNALRDATSDDTSPQTEQQDASQNGTSSSELQIDSSVTPGSS